MKDYAKYEGKEVDFILHGEPVRAIVVGCDYDIGITIVEKDDPSHYLYCQIGPSAPNYKKPSGVPADYAHGRMFNWVVNAIESGTLDNAKLDHEIADTYNISPFLFSTCMQKPSVYSCPFSQ